ncbi:MAG: hypothetical protein BM564_12995 [Bacteroidetes bacterium MedPE-SWsnd-G2]|nr:MAG: hypothetical protein BM564_12995 [Bacteroidetes bacterium MedPE-SWsnd-G2]
MKVAIHYEPLNGISMRLKRYEKILKYNNFTAVFVSSSSQNFINQLEGIDALIWYVGLADVSKQPYFNWINVLENDLGINCFPSSNATWSFDNKLRQIHQMTASGIPFVKSRVLYQKEEAIKLTNLINYPIIFKLSAGAGSFNVIKVNNKKTLINYVNLMFGKGVLPNKLQHSLGYSFRKEFLSKLVKLRAKFLGRQIDYRDLIPDWNKQSNYLLIQEFLPNNEFDTRVTTIGNRAFAFRRFNRKGDFRSSGSGIIDYNAKAIDLDCVKLALEISKKMNFESMAYDFLYNKEGNPVICEYSYGYNDEAIYNCSGYWTEDLKFVMGNFWPQFLQLKDLLKLEDLKQPESL